MKIIDNLLIAFMAYLFSYYAKENDEKYISKLWTVVCLLQVSLFITNIIEKLIS